MNIYQKLLNHRNLAVILQLVDGTEISAGIYEVDYDQLKFLNADGLRKLTELHLKHLPEDEVFNNSAYFSKLSLINIADCHL